MVVDESCRPKVAQWLGRCGRSLRGQARKAFHCGRDEIAITSGLPNEGIPKPARSWNPKRASSLKVSHESRLQQRSSSKVASVAALQSNRKMLPCAVSLLAKAKGLEARGIDGVQACGTLS